MRRNNIVYLFVFLQKSVVLFLATETTIINIFFSVFKSYYLGSLTKRDVTDGLILNIFVKVL